MYSELRDASLYHEYAALGFLLCPSLLLHPDGKYLDLFRLVLCDQLVVTLYRELVGGLWFTHCLSSLCSTLLTPSLIDNRTLISTLSLRLCTATTPLRKIQSTSLKDLR